jgi:hypothetical protein
MRRTFTAGLVMGLVGVLACGSFEANGAPPVEDTEDAGKTKPRSDAAAPSEAGADAGETCEVVIQHAFDSGSIGGWTAAGDNLEFGLGPDEIPALKVTNLQSHGDLVRTYIEQKVPYPGIRSVHTEFDFAYDQVDPNASLGCVTNLARSVPFGEARIQLARDSQGLQVASGFSDGTAPVNSELAQVTPPDPHAWTPVIFDLSVGSDGTIERKFDFGGQVGTMSAYVTPGSAGYDAVHVLCGVNGLQGENAVANIYLKSLVVTACKKP